MTFKKGNDGAYVVTWVSDEESEDEDNCQRKNKAMISMGFSKKPSIFDTSSSCFMAKDTKVYHSDSDDDSPCAKEVKYDSDSENEKDEPSKE